MSDRTSAEIFGNIFVFLASMPQSPERDIFALEVWDMSQGDYDFSNYQMEADWSLIKLGLARRGVHPDYPNDGETTLYGPVTA